MPLPSIKMPFTKIGAICPLLSVKIILSAILKHYRQKTAMKLKLHVFWSYVE